MATRQPDFRYLLVGCLPGSWIAAVLSGRLPPNNNFPIIPLMLSNEAKLIQLLRAIVGQQGG
jgi:hypothetical protein